METVRIITKEQYYQLMGLQLAAQNCMRTLDNLTKSALEITQEKNSDGYPDELGHTSDYISDFRSLDEMLKLLKIEVK
jgi:hypothetical protein